MKDFRDFLASFQEDDIIAIMNDASSKAAEIAKLPAANVEANLGNQIGAISFTIALELLGFYHKWLEQ